MIIDTHSHVVSSDKAKHPLNPGARGWSTEVSNYAQLVEPFAGYGEQVEDPGKLKATLILVRH